MHLPTGTVRLVVVTPLLRLLLLLMEEVPAPMVLVAVRMLSPARLENAAASMDGVEQRRTTAEQVVSPPLELVLVRPLLRLRPLLLLLLLLMEEVPALTAVVAAPMVLPALLGNAVASMDGAEQRRTTVERAVSLPLELALVRPLLRPRPLLLLLMEEVPALTAVVAALMVLPALLGFAAASMDGAEQRLTTVEGAVRVLLAHVPRLVNFVEICASSSASARELKVRGRYFL